MKVLMLRPGSVEAWLKIHSRFHLDGKFEVQLIDEHGQKHHSYIAACHPELMAFSLVVD